MPNLILPALKRIPTACFLSPLSGYEIQEAFSFKPRKPEREQILVARVGSPTRVKKKRPVIRNPARESLDCYTGKLLFPFDTSEYPIQLFKHWIWQGVSPSELPT